MAQELHVFTPDEAHTDALKGIKTFLDQKAQDDPVFAIKYLTGGKTLIGAVRYLAHKNIENVVLKGEKSNGKTFDFAINSDAADNELAASYFMDDTLDYEKGATPSAPSKEPKEKQTKKKSSYNKTSKSNTPHVSSSTTTQRQSATQAIAAQPTVKTEADDDIIDLFAGLFD